MDCNTQWEENVLQQTDIAELWQQSCRKCTVVQLLAHAFCQRFLPAGDIGREQMTQCCILTTGCCRITPSMRLRLKVTLDGIGSLREAFASHLLSHSLPLWRPGHPRYETMCRYAQQHDNDDDYRGLARCATDEEMANLCITLCDQSDALLCRLLMLITDALHAQGIHADTPFDSPSLTPNAPAQLHALREENSRLREENALLCEENDRLNCTGSLLLLSWLHHNQ